ncbi:hypothetical protein C8Q74DRAFT_1370719 [Fomes fomentarius]|nr:hypothetical protein C8Q74DRAFT_1370719 [Fomes fomentarius]
MSTSFGYENQVPYKDLEAEFVDFLEEDVGAQDPQHWEPIDFNMHHESYDAPLLEVPAYVTDCPEYLAQLTSPHGRRTVGVYAIDADNMEEIRRTGHTIPVITVSLQSIEGQLDIPLSDIPPISTNATETSQKRKASPTMLHTEGSSSGSHQGMSKRRKMDLENIAPSATDEGWGSDLEKTDREDEDYVLVASSSSPLPRKVRADR